MSSEAVVGGVAVGALSLPVVLAAETIGGLIAAVVVLGAVIALSGGIGSQYESESQSCHRCGERNALENAVCSVCQAQL